MKTYIVTSTFLMEAESADDAQFLAGLALADWLGDDRESLDIDVEEFTEAK